MIVANINRLRAMRKDYVDRLRSFAPSFDKGMSTLDFALKLKVERQTVWNWRKQGALVLDIEDRILPQQTLELWDKLAAGEAPPMHNNVTRCIQIPIVPEPVKPPTESITEPSKMPQVDPKATSRVVRRMIRQKAKVAAIEAVKDILFEEADKLSKLGDHKLEAEILRDCITLEQHFDEFWRPEEQS